MMSFSDLHSWCFLGLHKSSKILTVTNCTIIISNFFSVVRGFTSDWKLRCFLIVHLSGVSISLYKFFSLFPLTNIFLDIQHRGHSGLFAFISAKESAPKSSCWFLCLCAPNRKVFTHFCLEIFWYCFYGFIQLPTVVHVFLSLKKKTKLN